MRRATTSNARLHCAQHRFSNGWLGKFASHIARRLQ